jgi:hypothetical protein
MSGILPAFIVVGLIGSGMAVAYLWRREADWWQGWRDWLQYAPLLVLAYWFGVLHGFLREWLGIRLSLFSLLVVIVLAAVGVILNEPHLLPPGVRVQRHTSKRLNQLAN